MTSLRIFFVPMMEAGHVQPLIGVMQRLAAAGHTLACYGVKRDKVEEQFRRAGIPCAWFPVDGGGSASASVRKTAQLRDPRRLFRWMTLGVTSSLEPSNVEQHRAAIRAFKPDVVCVDPMVYPGCAAAELEGVPWAAMSPLMISVADPAWTCPWVDAARELGPVIVSRMHELGVERVSLRVWDVVSPFLNTVFVTEQFAPRSWSGNNTSWYLGASKPIGARGDESDFPWPRLREDVPIVYVSSGAGQSLTFEPQTLLDICNSLSEDEAQFVCVSPLELGDDFVRKLPKSCVLVRYAPQVELLERRAAVAVTHGGINSVTECLTYGRPMLVLPIGHEQFVQAGAVEAGGLGRSLDVEHLTVEDCRSALMGLLDAQAPFHEALAHVRRSFSVDGAAKAADLITTLARSKKPLPPAIET